MFGHYIKKAWMQKLDLNWPLPFIDASINLGLKDISAHTRRSAHNMRLKAQYNAAMPDCISSVLKYPRKLRQSAYQWFYC